MKPKRENSWFMIRLLLLMNIVLISAIVLMHSYEKHSCKTQSCSDSRTFNVDALNSITVKLM